MVFGGATSSQFIIWKMYVIISILHVNTFSGHENASSKMMDEKTIERICNASKGDNSSKFDVVIVDPSALDRHSVESGPGLIEKAWIMARPPAELLLDHKLVSARKIQSVRDQINCWTNQYKTIKTPQPPPKPEPIKNCDLDRKPGFCMIRTFDTCAAPRNQSSCAYEFPSGF